MCVCPVKCVAVSVCPVKCVAVSVCVYPVKCVAVCVYPVKCADGSFVNTIPLQQGHTKNSIQNIGKVGKVGFSAGQKQVIKT